MIRIEGTLSVKLDYRRFHGLPPNEIIREEISFWPTLLDDGIAKGWEKENSRIVSQNIETEEDFNCFEIFEISMAYDRLAIYFTKSLHKIDIISISKECELLQEKLVNATNATIERVLPEVDVRAKEFRLLFSIGFIETGFSKEEQQEIRRGVTCTFE